MTTMEKIELFKDQRAKEIANDTTTTTLEKLALLHEIWPLSQYIQNEFSVWEDEFRVKYPEWKYSIDYWHQPSSDRYQKYESVPYFELLASISDDLDEDGMLPVLSFTDYPNSPVEFKKSYEEIESQILNYALEHKISGFTNDW